MIPSSGSVTCWNDSYLGEAFPCVFQFILKDIIEDTDEQTDEEVGTVDVRSGDSEQRSFCPCGDGVCVSLSWYADATQK